MTSRPTVEPAGVSEADVKMLRAAHHVTGSLAVVDVCDELLATRQQIAEMRSSNKATHAVQTHRFADHEMTWDQRCTNCGAFDSELSASACDHSKQLAEMRGAALRLVNALRHPSQGLLSQGGGLTMDARCGLIELEAALRGKDSKLIADVKAAPSPYPPPHPQEK